MQVLANPQLAAMSGGAAPAQWPVPPSANRAALGAGLQPPATAHATQQALPGKVAISLWAALARARWAMYVWWPSADFPAAKSRETLVFFIDGT